MPKHYFMFYIDTGISYFTLKYLKQKIPLYLSQIYKLANKIVSAKNQLHQ